MCGYGLVTNLYYKFTNTHIRMFFPKHLCLGLLFFTDASIHTEQVRMLPFQGRSCYWQNILLLLYPAITENTQAHEMRIDGRAFYLVNDLNEPPTGLRSARGN